jgi:hypothetical protein
MPAITLDQELRAKLNGLNEVMPVQDETGRTIGHFVPDDLFKKMLQKSVSIPYSEEELKRRDQEVGTYTLQEIWKELGVS